MNPLDISTNFVKEIMRKEKSDGKCYHVCYPLSLFLDNNSYPNQIIRGTFKKNHNEVGINHYWLRVNGNEENIIDPTKRQFYPDEKKLVFYGKKPKEYEIKPLENEYEGWLRSYRTRAYLYDKETFDLSSFLPVTLRAAILINNDIPDKKRISVCPKLSGYFKGIYAILDYQIYYNRQTVDTFASQHLLGFEALQKTLLSEDLGPH